VIGIFYDVGWVVGLLGMVVVVGVLVWTLTELGTGFLGRFVREERVVVVVVKRGTDSAQAGGTTLLKPIVSF
jgi:hypothetical protein